MAIRSSSEDLILTYFHQLLLEDAFTESSQNAFSLTEDPEYFQSLWEVYLNYEVLAEGDRLSLNQQLELKLANTFNAFRLGNSSTLSATALTALPALRSSGQQAQYQEGVFELYPTSLPGIKLLLTLKAKVQGFSLELTSAKALPSWVNIKLLKGRKLVEMQNFGSEGCSFFCPTPQGNWSLVLNDISGKRKDCPLVTLKFK